MRAGAAFAEQAPEGLWVADPGGPKLVEVLVNGQWVGDLFLCCDPADNRCRDLRSDVIARAIGLPGRDCGTVSLPELGRCLGVPLEMRDGYRLFITSPRGAGRQ